MTFDSIACVPRFPYRRFQQTVITSLGVRKVALGEGSKGLYDGRHEDVNCPVCGARRVERYMRTYVHQNDPMVCGDCGQFFLAADVPGMWH